MKTHNAVIYHCLACGAIMHCEHEQGAPQCCGKPMVKAAAETIVDGGSCSRIDAGRPVPAPPTLTGVERKPR